MPPSAESTSTSLPNGRSLSARAEPDNCNKQVRTKHVNISAALAFGMLTIRGLLHLIEVMGSGGIAGVDPRAGQENIGSKLEALGLQPESVMSRNVFAMGPSVSISKRFQTELRLGLNAWGFSYSTVFYQGRTQDTAFSCATHQRMFATRIGGVPESPERTASAGKWGTQ